MDGHQAPDWMDELESLCDLLGSEMTNPEFRLWITSRPHASFSVPVLQMSFKIALEEPTTFKTNLARHLRADKAFAQSFDRRSNHYRDVIIREKKEDHGISDTSIASQARYHM